MRLTFTIAMMAVLAGSMLALPHAGEARQGGWLRERLQQRADDSRKQDDPAGKEMAYGADPLQRLDFWRATRADAPLVIFIHGGGWKRGDKAMATGSAKVSHYLEQGYAFASVNYRLVPANSVEEQAQDVADAIAWMLSRAAQLGFDSHRVVLMGHSAGAHLSALVGTDPRYLHKAGLTPDSLSGVIPLDGAAYDVARQISEGGNFMHDTYVQAFGTDPARQRALSPTLQAARPNAPSFLILHVEREDGTVQSNALAAALRQAGTPAEVHALGGRGLRGHAQINRSLGEADYAGTPIVDAYLKQIFRPQ